MRLTALAILLFALAGATTSGSPVIQRVNQMIQAAQSAEQTIQATANKEMQQVLSIVEAVLKALLGERNYALVKSALQQAVAAIRGAISPRAQGSGNMVISQDAGSWDGYIDNLIAQTKDASGTPHADKAVIFGIDGGAPWTTAGHAHAWKMSASEMQNIARVFKSRDFSAFMASGIYAEGVKYQFLREEDGKVVYGKRKGEGAITCQASKHAVVCAHTIEGKQQGNVNKGVAVIAEYLEGLGMLTTSQDAGSWDSYIDNLLAQTKVGGVPQADKACIFGIDGGAPWTTAGHAHAWKMSASEMQDIARVFKSGDFSSFMAGGIYAEGVKYQFLREEDKKIVLGKRKGQGALTCQASKTAVVCAHTPEGSQQGAVNKGVAVIAEYLEGMNMLTASQDAGSWDGYIDNLLAQTKDTSGTVNADKAIIFGLDGGAKWTTDSHASSWKLSATECQTIAKAMKSKDFTTFMANGIRAEGVKYQFLREEDGKVILGKRKGEGAITCQASKTAVVCAHTIEGMQQGAVNKGVAVIAEYLESLGMLTTSQEASAWDGYIDNLIAQTKDSSGHVHADKACIFGIDGGAQWTSDSHAHAWKLSASERSAIAKAMKSKDFTGLMAGGIYAAGVKYQFLREEDGKQILGKKKGEGAITCQASKTAVVCAHTIEGQQQGNVNKGVAVIAEYLEGLGMLAVAQDAGSWDSYIDNLLAQTKENGVVNADMACIFGLDGGASWTSDGHYASWKMYPSEKQAIAKALKSKDFTSLQASGIYAAGVKYQYLREVDGKIILGKRKGEGALTCQASKTAVVCAHTKEGAQQGAVNKGVAVIAEYLESLGMLAILTGSI